MAYSITSNPPVDLWRRFVFEHSNGNIFHTPEMTNVFKQTRFHQPLIFAYMNTNKEIQYLTTAVQVKTISNLPSRIAARCVLYGGLLWREDDKSKGLTILMNSLDEEAKKKSLFAEIRNISDTSVFNNKFINCGYEYYDYLNYLIPLNKELDYIFRNFSRSRKQNIKRLQKQGVSVEEVHERERITKVYEILKSTYSRIQIPLADISLFETTFNVMYPSGMAKFYLAKMGGEEIAAAVALFYKKIIYVWYLGTKNDFLKMNPVSIVVWHLIKWGAKNGYKTLDFLGAGRPEEPYGVREFKRRFGGEQVCYGRYQKIYHPSLLKISDTAYRVYRKLL